MKWQEYEQMMKDCPDEQLFEQCCLSSNFPIIWSKLPLEDAVSCLLSTGRYQRHSFENEVDKNIINRSRLLSAADIEMSKKACNKQIAYVPGAIVLAQRKEADLTHGGKEIWGFQKSHYSAGFMLNLNQIKEVEGVRGFRVMARVIEDIVETVLVPNEAPFCLPKVFHYKKGVERQDYSTIVFWPDADEDYVMREIVRK